MPIVKAYSYRSNLYHEKMIENIFKTTLNKLAYNYNDDIDTSDKLRIDSNMNEEEFLKKLEKRKNCKLYKI
jgi:hypothetical protein